MSIAITIVIALAIALIFSVLVPERKPWYLPLYAMSSEASAKYRQEMMYLDSLILKFALEKDGFTKEAFYEQMPGIAECSRCHDHLEMALYTMIASNRLQRREGTQTYELTEHAKRLLEYIDEHPKAHALSILPMSKLVYWHNAIHADHSHLLS